MPSEIAKTPQVRFLDNPKCALRIPRLDDIWEYLSDLSTMGQFASMGQGLSFRPDGKIPDGATKYSDQCFSGAVRGFRSLGRKTMIHELPREEWVSVSGECVEALRRGGAVDTPQVLLSAYRVSRAQWRVKALMDRDGHAVTNNFLVCRPKTELPLEMFWAIWNSPIGNAFIWCRTDKRHNLAGTLARLPFPHLHRGDVERVVAAVRAYTGVFPVVEPGHLGALPEPDTVRRALLEVDAEVLRLYDLPPRKERRLLDLFNGAARPGVPCSFGDYFDSGFRPCVPLHEYLSDDYRQMTVGTLRQRLSDSSDPGVVRALAAAEEAFTMGGED